MQEQPAVTGAESTDARGLYKEFQKIAVFAGIREEDLSCLGQVQVLHLPKGSVFYNAGDAINGFWSVIEGEVRGFKREEDGSTSPLMSFGVGESFGEVPLLAGHQATFASCDVVADTTLLGITEAAFWAIMSACPTVRRAILTNMERRLQHYQAYTLHREKLISLGTLAAGLMHELNNPGTAARRAAAQLRENLVQLQQISLRYCEKPMGDEQIHCMKELQTRALAGEKPKPMSTLDQSDAEECLADWLAGAGVENTWKMAPTLAAIGLTQQDLECTRQAFEGVAFSDALNWLVSLVSSMQLVGTVEESITRVSELVMAVKKYSYNERSTQPRALDIHDGLQSTLTILGHKLRPKDLKIDKQFAPSLPTIESRGAGLAQVWTNLLDNAVDASPQGGTIHIRTWVEEAKVCVGIADEGAGIAEEHRQHIFEPFFTTKPAGVGTGLGLDIVHRIVVGAYGGEVGFETRPGSTEFIVRIPILK